MYCKKLLAPSSRAAVFYKSIPVTMRTSHRKTRSHQNQKSKEMFVLSELCFIAHVDLLRKYMFIILFV